jgi:phage-related tail fiber protein
MAIVLDGTTGIDTPAINAGNIVGEVCFFGMSTAPAGFLKANGAAVSRTTYADLFAAIGTTYGTGDGSTTFNLPDMRGEFPRGWDDGRGVDSGRGIGTAQGDAIRNITGNFFGQEAFSNLQGAFFDNGAGSNNRPNNGSASTKNVGFDASLIVPTAAENRPRNVALLACIKF